MCGAHTFNPSTWKAETGEFLWVRGQSGLHSKVYIASQGYVVRHCLKKNLCFFFFVSFPVCVFVYGGQRSTLGIFLCRSLTEPVAWGFCTAGWSDSSQDLSVSAPPWWVTDTPLYLLLLWVTRTWVLCKSSMCLNCWAISLALYLFLRQVHKDEVSLKFSMWLRLTLFFCFHGPSARIQICTNTPSSFILKLFFRLST